VAPEWTPDRTVSVEQAAAVVAAHAPHLADLPVRPFDQGWDNTVLAVGTQWLFRFVHRAVALDGARRELVVLAHLATSAPLPLPVPVPLVVGQEPAGPGEGTTAWPFWGARILPGVELARSGLPDADRCAVATAVGGFLRALHGPELARWGAAAGLPVDPLHRSDPAVVVPRARARLDRLAATGRWRPDPRVEALLARAAGLDRPVGGEVLVHGDLHVRHVLVDGAAASGVIDWGDTALADPCVDLMIGWAAFNGSARRAFRTAYGPVSPDRELRARVLAVSVSTLLAAQAAEEGSTVLLTEALRAIERAAT